MGFYDSGMGASTYEGGLFTPSHVLAEMRTVDDAIQSLKDVVLASRTIPNTTKLGYLDFVKRWEAFTADKWDGAGAWVTRALNTTYAKVLEFRQQYRQWRARLEAAGARPVLPSLPVEHKRPWYNNPWIVAGGLAAALYFFMPGRRHF